MMTDIFEDKKSPFYHFGELMRLDKLPYEDFYRYLSERHVIYTNHYEIEDPFYRQWIMDEM